MKAATPYKSPSFCWTIACYSSCPKEMYYGFTRRTEKQVSVCFTSCSEQTSPNDEPSRPGWKARNERSRSLAGSCECGLGRNQTDQSASGRYYGRLPGRSECDRRSIDRENLHCQTRGHIIEDQPADIR